MLLTSDIEGFRGSHLATCLIFEAVILPARYLCHNFDLLCSLVFSSKHCACSFVTTRDCKVFETLK